MPRKKKSVGGRPSVITPKILAKLETAFGMGCTDIEACNFADISTTALYNYQKSHPEFAEWKARIKENPVLRARQTVVESLEKDVKTAQWYLERKRADEFAPQRSINVDVTHKLDDNQLIEQFNQVFQLLDRQQADIIDITPGLTELEHNPDDEQ